MNRKKSRTRSSNRETVTWEMVRQLALELPGAEEGTSYGTPAVKVGGKLMLRLREDGETFAVSCDYNERELLMEEQPEIFHITDHYLKYPWVLVRLSTVRPDQLTDLLKRAWRRVAPRRLVDKFHLTDGDV
jgi:hypothetical protein